MRYYNDLHILHLDERRSLPSPDTIYLRFWRGVGAISYGFKMQGVFVCDHAGRAINKFSLSKQVGAIHGLVDSV